MRCNLRLGKAERLQDREWVNECLVVLLAQHPELLRSAYKTALAAKAKVFEAGELPPQIKSETALRTSTRNVYGVFPDDLNSWEAQFGDYLDADDTDTVLWWHRNPPRKDWSINVLLETGAGFFPDFIVGIRERPTEQNGLLTDTKYAYETSREIPKLVADHEAHGRVIILSKNAVQRWAVAELDARTGAPRLAGVFRLADSANY